MVHPFWQLVETNLFVIAVSSGFCAIFLAVIAWQSIVRNKLLLNQSKWRRADDIEKIKKKFGMEY